jgi:hypothetical protein
MAYGRIPSSAPAAGSIGAAEIADGSVGAAELSATAVVLSKLGVGMVGDLKFTFTANGTPANSDDITIDYGALGLPAGTTWECFDCIQHVESGSAASATGQVRTASAGGGAAVTTAMGASANTKSRDAQAARTTGITNATQHFYRRTGGAAPSGTAGHLTLYLKRTA